MPWADEVAEPGPVLEAGEAPHGDFPKSSVLIPVREADTILGRWRYKHDPLAAVGVPAHITLVVPWLDPSVIDAETLAGLDVVLGDVKAFDFDLTHIDWFGRRVLWAAPEPVAPFIELINLLAEKYSTPPWGGQFDQVIPHLTIAHAGDSNLVSVAADVAVRLPLRCRAEKVWVMVGGGGTWKVVHKVRLLS